MSILLLRRSRLLIAWWVTLFSGGNTGVAGDPLPPCPTTPQYFVVNDTQGATTLANMASCSGGGEFNVRWQGSVDVEETITVTNGSILTIAGFGADEAIADGSGATRLFAVSGAFLNITDLQLKNGNSDDGGSSSSYFSAASSSWLHKGGGAISATEYSTVTLRRTSFKYNNGNPGGALYAVDSNVTLSEESSFVENTSGGYGGAVHFIGGSSSLLSCNGRTSFISNVAEGQGGAVYILSAAVVSWSGEVSYTDNRAVRGGAIGAQFGADVSWSGTANFSGNYAETEGGAVWGIEAKYTWLGSAIFDNNFAGFAGGAVFGVTGAELVWRGESRFSDNNSTEGGALAVDLSSNAFLAGDTVFTGNWASGASGGAVWVGPGSLVSCAGTTLFADNVATGFGGAIADDALSSESFGVLATLLFETGSSTTFEENVSGTNGGALAWAEGISVASSTAIVFTRNSAGVSGGAVYLSAVADGLTWPSGVSFIANSAQIGGAVYSLASGTTVATSEEFPVVYNGTLFQGNTASTSGGAVESAAGKDVFLYTQFVNNTAGIGGALRLAGTSDLIACDFVANGASIAGPAVSNVGAMRQVSNVSFVDNVLLCSEGTFLDYEVREDAQQENYNSVCDGCPVCPECVADGVGALECTVEYRHTVSSGIGVTVESLVIEAGYWRATETSATILPCWNEGACRGGATGASDFCDEGYAGPYCSVCEQGYAATLAYTCTKCSGGGGLTLTVLLLIVAAAVVVAVVAYLMSPHSDDEDNSKGGRAMPARRRLRKLRRAVPLQALKTIVVSWQILTQFDSVANVTYPGAYGRFLDGISSIVGFDLGWVLSIGCIVSADFHDRLLLSTLGPIVALVLLGVTYRVAVRRIRRGTSLATTGNVRRKHFSVALLVTFLVYSSVSSTVFRMFACEVLDDGKEYLRADYTIECDSPKHETLQFYAALMILVYPVGIPVLYAVLLFSNREVLKYQSPHLTHLKAMEDLWMPYKPGRFYYELVECARRIALTGVVVFIYPNTAGQVATTLVLAFLFVMVSESLAPYASNQDAWIARVGHMVVFLSMFQALLIKVDVSDERSDSQEVFGGVLLAANVCMVVAVIVETAIVTRSVLRQGGSTSFEDTVPRFRSTASATRIVENWEIVDGVEYYEAQRRATAS